MKWKVSRFSRKEGQRINKYFFFDSSRKHIQLGPVFLENFSEGWCTFVDKLSGCLIEVLRNWDLGG